MGEQLDWVILWGFSNLADSMISAHWLKETVYGIYSRPERHSGNTENRFNFQHAFFK